MFKYATRQKLGQVRNQNDYIKEAKTLQNKINRTNSLSSKGLTVTLNRIRNMYKPVLHVPTKFIVNGKIPAQLLADLSGKGRPPPFFDFIPLTNEKIQLLRNAQKQKARPLKTMLLKNGTFASLPRNVQQRIFKKLVVNNRMNF